MMIYVAHPYSDDPVGNMAKVELKLKELSKWHTEDTYISPLHAFSWQANHSTWEETMDDCLNLMQKCNRVYFCKGWMKSRGCREEMKTCDLFQIPYEVEE